jgi:fumarate hydratase class I
VVKIDLTEPMSEIRATLSRCPDQDAALAHGAAGGRARHRAREDQGALDRGGSMPQYLRDHCVYYAGPAKTPEGYASGSFGPTTAGRMDSYVDLFQSHGGSHGDAREGQPLARRSPSRACKHGGFYLGSIGGPAARLAQDCIKKVEVLEYPELGMEAVWKIDVVDFPAFIVVDDKGNDFFEGLTGKGVEPSKKLPISS